MKRKDDDPHNQNVNQEGNSSSGNGGDGSNKPKCQKCGNNATKKFVLTNKDTGVIETLILCDNCYQKEITCQECQKEITGAIKEANKNGSKIRVCEECNSKIKKVQEFQTQLGQYLDNNRIRDDLTLEQLNQFKELDIEKKNLSGILDLSDFI
ncbi:667_t:CDS:2, partial [Funneliformis geosporum]